MNHVYKFFESHVHAASVYVPDYTMTEAAKIEVKRARVALGEALVHGGVEDWLATCEGYSHAVSDSGERWEKPEAVLADLTLAHGGRLRLLVYRFPGEKTWAVGVSMMGDSYFFAKYPYWIFCESKDVGDVLKAALTKIGKRYKDGDYTA